MKKLRRQFDIVPVREVIAEGLGIEIQELTALGEHQLGDNNAVFHGTYEGRPVFVKVGENANKFEREAAAMEMLRTRGIPVPGVVGFVADVRIRKSVLVQEAARGISLDKISEENQQTAGLWVRAGEALRRIHEIPMSGFGPLELKDRRLDGRYGLWEEFLNHFRKQLGYVKEHDLLDTESCQKVMKTIDTATAASAAVAPKFLHGDYHDIHIFTDGYSISDIIDLGEAKAGDPLMDVAYAHYYLPKEQSATFSEGYGLKANDERVTYYLLLIAVAKVAYRHKNGFTSRMPSALSVLQEALAAT